MPRPQQEAQQQTADGLLALPEPLLVAVLQCLAAPADQRSLFSAARAHSRLHQAAVAALGSFAVTGVEQQQRLDGVLLYLGKHGEHVSSLSLAGAGDAVAPDDEDAAVVLRQLPPTLQLHSLELEGLKLQLLPDQWDQGVLGYHGVSALQQLRLKGCTLLDEDDDAIGDDWEEGQRKLAAALAQQLPPSLQHLSIDKVCFDGGFDIPCPLSFQALQQRLQQLTRLELLHVAFEDAGDDSGAETDASPTLQQPLQAFSRLVDLRLTTSDAEGTELPASMLSGAAGLTRLELEGLFVQPGLLAGKTQLQHLYLHSSAGMEDPDTGRALQLLSQLESLTQLTHLQLSCCLDFTSDVPETAFSALTASSSLQHLELNDCSLPDGAWQHVFPAGRQLPHLTSLELIMESREDFFSAAPAGSLLVSCCPGLRCLEVQSLLYSAGAFAPLQGLTGLHTLLATANSSDAVKEVCQLTGLRDLDLDASDLHHSAHATPLLQLTQLRQLTALSFVGPHDGGMADHTWVAEAPGDEPVWRQVLRLHLDHSDPAVAQAAAAALQTE